MMTAISRLISKPCPQWDELDIYSAQQKLSEISDNIAAMEADRFDEVSGYKEKIETLEARVDMLEFVGERMAEALGDHLDYRGGAVNGCGDELVMERSADSLAAWKEVVG